MTIRTHKQIVRFWAHATDGKEFHEVPKLAMDITTNLNGMFSHYHIPTKAAYRDWAVDILNVRLFDQDFPCLKAQLLHFRFADRLAAF